MKVRRSGNQMETAAALAYIQPTNREKASAKGTSAGEKPRGRETVRWGKGGVSSAVTGPGFRFTGGKNGQWRLEE